MTKLEAYQQAINKIDDLLEYRYKSMSIMGIRAEILDTIENIAKKITV